MPDVSERLRSDALVAFQAAVAAVQPGNLIPSAVSFSRRRVSVLGTALPRVVGRRVLLALGKAAPTLAEAWLESLPEWTNEVLVLTPHGVPVSPQLASAATVLRGAHPYPDAAGEASARRVLELAHGLDERDLLVVLLSGGASALLAAPEAGLELCDVRAVTRALLEAGAPINAVNAVRRQLLAAGGGGLARAAYPAQVVTLVLSDVLGDPLADIASGPTVPSPTTPADALAVLGRYAVRDRVADRVPAFLEQLAHAQRPSEQGWIERTRTVILANNGTAVEAAASSLRRVDYSTVICPTPLVGEAAARGVQLGALATAVDSPSPWALVVGGETTVTVRGSGRGGRSQELALAAAVRMTGASPCALLAAGTDGIDGVSESAGAIVDPGTISRLHAAAIDPAAALASNDSGSALAAIGDTIVTGPTGTNVCDIVIVLAAP
jgi:glycerate-2-kinase